MPTVLLIDVSLSMACTTRCAQHTPNRNGRVNAGTSHGNANGHGDHSCSSTTTTVLDAHAVTKKSLAVHSVYKFLDSLTIQSKLEQVSLVIFSSSWEHVVPFTRDYDAIKSAVDGMELFDKTCLEGAFTAAHEVLQEMWTTTPCQAVIITDGRIEITQELYAKIEAMPLPSQCNVHLHCLSTASEFCCSETLNQLHKFMESINGTMSVLDGVASYSTVDAAIDKYVQNTYKIYSGTLHCGNLGGTVQLYPAPISSLREDDFTSEELEFPHELSVVGFISQADIRSPGCASRHLVLPLRETSESTDEEKVEDGRIPSCAVLLHGALKVESYVAIVKIRDEWYGMLHSWADSKKKSNLVLSVFNPGLYSVPWLGSFKMLNCLPSQTEPLPGVVVQQLPGLPVPVTDKKSYSNTSPSWLRQATLQSDVQKLLRYGRKLPEKLNIFYKELNRIHKAAVSIGFYQLLIGISQILERECTLLPPSAHPDAAMQLQHAASLLSKKEVLNINIIIRPLDTNFQNNYS